MPKTTAARPRSARLRQSPTMNTIIDVTSSRVGVAGDAEGPDVPSASAPGLPPRRSAAARQPPPGEPGLRRYRPCGPRAPPERWTGRLVLQLPDGRANGDRRQGGHHPGVGQHHELGVHCQPKPADSSGREVPTVEVHGSTPTTSRLPVHFASPPAREDETRTPAWRAVRMPD